MHEYYLNLYMSASDVERNFYGSGLRDVVATSENGIRIQLAMRHLFPYITHDGIRGRFRLRTDANHKFISLKKVAHV